MKTARLALLIPIAAGLLLHTPSASAAEATANPMQSRVDALIAEFGGTQTGPNEISWDGGATVLDLAPTSATKVGGASSMSVQVATTIGGCAAGSHCIYGGSNYSGDKVTFSGCSTSESVALLDGAVRSVANATTSSTVKVYSGTTLLATAAAGSGKNVTGTATKISCS